MRISAKIDYATKALLELALHWPRTEPLSVQVIGQRQKIPIKFLIQILIQLKQLGYVESTRGKNGGYRLIVEPKTISLKEIVQNLEGVPSQKSGAKKTTDVMVNIWREVDAAVLKTLEALTFEMIANRQRSRDNVVMFEI